MDPSRLASELADLGPRVEGSAGSSAARRLLTGAMVDVGLESVAEIRPAAGDRVHLTGSLAGRSPLTTVLTAHYDSAAETRGLLDNASGCGVALAAMADLSRTPREHRVQLILTDGEEAAAQGSRELLAAKTGDELEAILANLNIEMVGHVASGPGVLHLTVADDNGRHRVSPAWLVHAVLRAAETIEMDLAVQDHRWSWFAQLAVRISTPSRLSDARSFLSAGVPSVTLSDLALTATPPAIGTSSGNRLDAGRLERWVELVAASTRRLDALAGRPVYETDYLVIGDRVWVRRDLIWPGFLLWMISVWRGLPGRWRRQPAGERRRAGRAYLPGFAFRMVFLLTLFLIPLFAALLLYPMAISSLFAPGRAPRTKQALCVVGAVPTLAFLVWLSVAQVSGWLVLGAVAWLPTLLVALTLGTASVWMLESPT